MQQLRSTAFPKHPPTLPPPPTPTPPPKKKKKHKEGENMEQQKQNQCGTNETTNKEELHHRFPHPPRWNGQ